MLSRRKFMTLSVAATYATATGCGTLLHPERRGQPPGRLDWKIVALDGVGLLLFLVPGVIAFAVDFVQGTIYLPPDGYAATEPDSEKQLISRQLPPDQFNQVGVEQVVSDHLGEPFHLNEGEYQVERISHVDEFWVRHREYQMG